MTCRVWHAEGAKRQLKCAGKTLISNAINDERYIRVSCLLKRVYRIGDRTVERGMVAQVGCRARKGNNLSGETTGEIGVHKAPNQSKIDQWSHHAVRSQLKAR